MAYPSTLRSDPAQAPLITQPPQSLDTPPYCIILTQISCRSPQGCVSSQRMGPPEAPHPALLRPAPAGCAQPRIPALSQNPLAELQSGSRSGPRACRGSCSPVFRIFIHSHNCEYLYISGALEAALLAGAAV